uniref:Structural maintenance of chromosomes protein n=1 Tax=Schistosoma haematobium TaxID=6185 RepID=A0A095ALF5_SCHHA
MTNTSELLNECPPIMNDEDILNDCGPVDIPPPPPLAQSLDANGPRLMITQIVTENFKSYGGMRVMGPFHKNFSCIIGPNGSGKSNVIDSMLFVFGYRASKVRSKKISQLIHYSELVPNASSCEVSVHFQKIIDHGPGALDYEVVPNSQFVISRRAYKDNSSCYLVDGTRAVYRDVANLLRSHGVDIDHNRFLILQGEVEQIALMKPKAPSEHEDGFLEYLEDIIGSSRFKQPLNIFINRIEKLNDLRLEKLSRVKLIEKEKDELESVRNEAMDYLRLVNQLIKMKNILYQQNLFNEYHTIQMIKEKLMNTQKETENLSSQVREKTRQIKRLESDRDELTQRHAQLQIRHRDGKAKFAEFEAQDGQLRDEHAHTKTLARRLAKAIQVERTKLEELERLPGEADARREAIKKQLAEFEEAKKKHEEETADNLSKESAPLRIKVEESESMLAPLQTEADQITSKLTLERQQYDLMMAGQRRELERMETAKKSMQSTQSKLKEREQELADAKKQLSSSGSGGNKGNLEMALASATRDLAEVKTHEADLTKELNDLRSKLTESKSALQADNSRNRMLNALLEAKRSGTLTGILGRLGDLGAIPSRYDIAISTASLDKMKKWAEKSSIPFNMPKVSFQVERLYDLIQTVDSNVKPAFYFALRDTLVTENLNAATKVAFGQQQRYRVVTLQGQVIEVSGAMSGGGGRPLSGRIMADIVQVKKLHEANYSCESRHKRLSTDSSKETNDLSALERQLTQGDAELGRLRDTRSRLEEMIVRMTRQRDESERTIKRCENECVRLHVELKALTDEVKQSEERVKSIGPSDIERKKFEKQLEKLEHLTQQKCSIAAKKREELEILKNQLLNFGSDRLATVRTRLDIMEKKIKDTNDELTKLEVSLKTVTRNQQKSMDKLKNMENEAELLKTKLMNIDNKLKQLEDDARACMLDYQNIQNEVEELQKLKEKCQTELTEAENTLATVQKAENSSRRLIGQFESELAQATTNARHWERELRGLRLHRIDDDDDDDDDDEEEEGKEGLDVVIGEENVTVSSVSQDVSQSIVRDSVVHLNNEKSPTLQLNEQQRINRKADRETKNLPKFTDEELQNLHADLNEMKHLEERIPAMAPNMASIEENRGITAMAPNMASIEEYRRKAENYLTRVSELNHITNILGEQRKHMEDAKSKRLSEFLDGFHAITNKLKEMYQMITQGGDAELELIDSLDPFSEGIVFSVRPPKKSWKNIANLSGGEKTLSSLALVFALHHYKPTPLYVMDEIDAALDFKNVSIVGNYLKERTKNAQFIVISLRNNMFELSDRLVGIYKTYNITKTITLDPSPLMEHLRSLVMRVATAHGHDKDLSLLPQQQQLKQLSPPPSSQQKAMMIMNSSTNTNCLTPVKSINYSKVTNLENHDTVVLKSNITEIILVNDDNDDDEDNDTDMQTKRITINEEIDKRKTLITNQTNDNNTESAMEC